MPKSSDNMSNMYVTGWAKLDGTESDYVPWMTLKHKLQAAVGQSKLVPFDEIDLDLAKQGLKYLVEWITKKRTDFGRNDPVDDIPTPTEIENINDEDARDKIMEILEPAAVKEVARCKHLQLEGQTKKRLRP